MIYEEGRTVIHHNVNTVGTLNTIGRQQITTTGSIRGVDQNDASKSAAPPKMPELPTEGESQRLIGMFVAVIAPIVVFTGLAATDAGFGVSFMLALSALVIAVVVTALIDVKPTEEELAEHQRKHPEAYAAYNEWAKTFACNSCGHRFIPD